MRATSFWTLISDNERKAITMEATVQVFEDGAALCLEGEPSTHVFILVSGWVKITTVTREGREILEALCGKGDIVGEIAGHVTGYRIATVRAIGIVHTLIVAADRFGKLLETHPDAARVHRRTMADHQRIAYQSHRNHILSSGPQRLACLLLDLAEPQSEPAGKTLTTAIPLSQDELANLIGASRSTVTRALRNWRSRNLIVTDQRNITILDPDRLLRIAGRSRAIAGQSRKPPGTQV